MATVLVVEDSPTQAANMQKKLGEQGVDVVIATDGLEGLRMATEIMPDVIVLDVNLPKMDGIQLCARLKRHKMTADIPVLMMSTNVDPEHTMAGLNAGAEDYIPKDIFAANYLLETLRGMALIQ